MKNATAKTMVSTKGQVILPKAIREKLKWKPGTELNVEETPNGVLLDARALLCADKTGGCRGNAATARSASITPSEHRRNGRGRSMAEARRRARD